MTELWPKIKEETPMVLKVSQRRGWSLWEHFPLNIFVLIYLINFPQPFFFSLTVFFFGAESYPNGSFSHELNSIDKTQRLRRIHVKMVIWHFSVAYFLLSIEYQKFNFFMSRMEYFNIPSRPREYQKLIFSCLRLNCKIAINESTPSCIK